MHRWEYLLTDAYACRFGLAEHFVSNFAEVVDVGTYRRTLNTKGKLWSIDPLNTVNGFAGSVSEFVDKHFDSLGNYALVSLGFALEGGEKEFKAFRKLADSASILVMDWAVGFQNIGVDPLGYFVDRKQIFYSDMTFPPIETPGFPAYRHRKFKVGSW
jgi:hypothetical protein